MTAEQLSMIVFIGDHSVRFWLDKCVVAFFLKCTDDDLVIGQITIFLNFCPDAQSVSLRYLLTMLEEMEYYNFFNILVGSKTASMWVWLWLKTFSIRLFMGNRNLHFRVCSFTLPGFQIFARRSLFNAATFFFVKSKYITFIAQKTGIIHLFKFKNQTSTSQTDKES